MWLQAPHLAIPGFPRCSFIPFALHSVPFALLMFSLSSFYWKMVEICTRRASVLSHTLSNAPMCSISHLSIHDPALQHAPPPAFSFHFCSLWMGSWKSSGQLNLQGSFCSLSYHEWRTKMGLSLLAHDPMACRICT